MAIFEPTKDISEIQKLIDHLKQEKKKVVVTSGCFDLLHCGHLEFLNQAKTQGDLLIVLVSVDKDVQAIKGKSRPIIPGRERAKLVAALAVVDHVILHSGDIYFELLKVLHPYKIAIVSEYETYETHLKRLNKFSEHGLVIIPRGEQSTTKIIERCVNLSSLQDSK